MATSKRLKSTDREYQTYASQYFYTSDDGFLFCEELKVKSLCDEIDKEMESSSPYFLYSKRQIEENVMLYTDALRKYNLPHLLGFAMKANYTVEILRILQELGCTAVLVSGNELKLALLARFNPQNLIYNGNGKTRWEIELAVNHDVMMNADSLFDLRHINEVCEDLNKSARIFLRMNPDIDPEVHPYISTGLKGSKFGIEMKDMDKALEMVKCYPYLNLLGLHCHVGSTVHNTEVIQAVLAVMLCWVDNIEGQGFILKYLNIGGGLGINYEKYIQNEDDMPSPSDLVDSIAEKLSNRNLSLILEPGRSIIGNAAILVTKVIGVKDNEDKRFIVIDGSMAEVIRPSLYGAYHHIQLIEPTQEDDKSCKVFNVVGPICESADFLGQNRSLPRPHEGCGLAIRDVGAYCYVLSSNYNMRCRPAEILVDKDCWRIIRRAETLDDITRTCTEIPRTQHNGKDTSTE
ncbi:uncharacterized protein LOC144451810 [Glandiceps talaboti]